MEISKLGQKFFETTIQLVQTCLVLLDQNKKISSIEEVYTFVYLSNTNSLFRDLSRTDSSKILMLYFLY